MSDPIYEAQAYEIAKMARSISALEAENAKLVDVLHEVEAEAVHAYRCLQQDCETTANSSEHFFKKWWHAECECDRLKAENAKLRDGAYAMRQLYEDELKHALAENAKLRELVLDLYNAIDSVFWDGEVEIRERFEPRMSELGIEGDA